jgi:hypothetical protein
MPDILDETVRVAVTVGNAERMRQPDTKRVFSAKKEGFSQGISCFNCGKRRHHARDCRMKKGDGLSERSGRRPSGLGHVLRNSSTAVAPKGGGPFALTTVKSWDIGRTSVPSLRETNQ